MKRLFRALALPGLTLKQKAVVWYFTFSLGLVCCTEEAPFWFLLVELANLIYAGCLMRRVPLPDDTEKDNDNEV